MLGTALARAVEAPGHGFHWGNEAYNRKVLRGARKAVEPVGSLAQIINGPSLDASGHTNFVGALRQAMAMTGYSDVREFQRVGLVAGQH